MNADDPFALSKSDDRTVIRPVPGGTRADLLRQPPSDGQLKSSKGPLPQWGHLNPLESAASRLLALLTQLNHCPTHPDPPGLKKRLSQEIRVFQETAQARGIDQNTVYTARYVLCTVLDEAVLKTPWGNDTGWAQQSLLSTFHKEVSGGERFFQLLSSLGQNPHKNRDLLELMHLCLALGFEGRYRIVERGKDKLARIREWLYQVIQKERGMSERELSLHWQGVTDRRNPLMQVVPLWVFGAVAAGLLTMLFNVFLFQLNRLSDPVFQQVSAIQPPAIEVAEETPPPAPIDPPQPEVTLSMLLADEIRNNQVKVDESSVRSTVTVQEKSLFGSGSATINHPLIPLLHRIGESLNQLPGQVLITGHTDSTPIRSTRYPSNWHLSKARAQAVADVIKQDLDEPTRTAAEGRADLEPVAPNDTPTGRAKNRRVEIILLN